MFTPPKHLSIPPQVQIPRNNPAIVCSLEDLYSKLAGKIPKVEERVKSGASVQRQDATQHFSATVQHEERGAQTSSNHLAKGAVVSANSGSHSQLLISANQDRKSTGVVEQVEKDSQPSLYLEGKLLQVRRAKDEVGDDALSSSSSDEEEKEEEGKEEEGVDGGDIDVHSLSKTGNGATLDSSNSIPHFKPSHPKGKIIP